MVRQTVRGTEGPYAIDVQFRFENGDRVVVMSEEEYEELAAARDADPAAEVEALRKRAEAAERAVESLGQRLEVLAMIRDLLMEVMPLPQVGGREGVMGVGEREEGGAVGGPWRATTDDGNGMSVRQECLTYDNSNGNGGGGRIICIDLDGTLAHYGGWGGEFTPIGPPILDPNGFSAKAFTRALADSGWRIIIHTCRGDEDDVRRWLDEHDIAYHAVNCSAHNAPGSSNKPIATVYLDDRGIGFRGDYCEAFDEIVKFKCWWEGRI